MNFTDFFHIPGAVWSQAPAQEADASSATEPFEASFTSTPAGRVAAAAVLAFSLALAPAGLSSWTTRGSPQGSTSTVDVPYVTYWLTEAETSRLDELIESTGPTAELAEYL